MATITEIRRCGPGLRRRALVIDGDHWRDVPSGLIAIIAVDVADEVDLFELEERIRAAEPALARERAIRLITARERSCHGLVERLVDDGFARAVAEGASADLERIGLIDDDRYAHALARTLANARGAGRARITRELRQAGIAEELAAQALEEALDPDEERAAASRLAQAAAARPGATVDKIASRLLRRGYRSAVALAVAREAIGAADRADDSGAATSSAYDD